MISLCLHPELALSKEKTYCLLWETLNIPSSLMWPVFSGHVNPGHIAALLR